MIRRTPPVYRKVNQMEDVNSNIFKNIFVNVVMIFLIEESSEIHKT